MLPREAWGLEECSGDVLGVFWGCSGGVLGVFWGCSGGILGESLQNTSKVSFVPLCSIRLQGAEKVSDAFMFP